MLRVFKMAIVGLGEACRKSRLATSIVHEEGQDREVDGVVTVHSPGLRWTGAK